MTDDQKNKTGLILPGNALKMIRGLTRRDFLKFSAGAVAGISLGGLTFGCGGKGDLTHGYPIDSTVVTTLDRMVSFPFTKAAADAGLSQTQLCEVSQYDALGYGAWTYGAPLPLKQRVDIMPHDYHNPTPRRITRFAKFFTITDIHITDKEAPNQLIYLQQYDATYSGPNTSIYSPVMLYTTHVLDAAMQTINALHKKNPFDFGISLGDTCNSTSYNELRWYIDVIDGQFITPSSGAHAGEHWVDYQKPFQAAGLDKSIPWYQTLGNHDHFYLGSFPVDADPALGLRESYISDRVWHVADFLTPDLTTFPAQFNMENITQTPSFYMGLLDGTTEYGNIIHAGAVTDPQFAGGPPVVAPDPNRRSLLRTEWIQEFFKTTSFPVGHGLNLVDPAQVEGFACYSFMPRPDIPLKIIVLDNTQSEHDGSVDIHGHGYLDANRWAWLQNELAAGQAANQLMIIAAHIPIGVSAIGSETEWMGADPNVLPGYENAVDLAGLVAALQGAPNLLAWIAGHRHYNTVKAFKSLVADKPEQGFWQVETSSLRDFPQQLRSFEIFLNSDYTVSIIAVNVDTAVAEGTPAAVSRKYAVAAQQIAQTDLTKNVPNELLAYGSIPVPSMDPTRTQGTPTTEEPLTDDSIQFVDLSTEGVPYNASYNAELFKQLSPEMISFLQAQFPTAG
ncbi:MAG: TIGR03768 family metallophosphoesterase [Pseudomonadota bacterium]